MHPRILGLAALSLGSLGALGCAGELPWPPPRDAYVTVSGRVRGSTRYAIGGRSATREEVEALVLDTPERRADVARGRRMETAGLAMILVGGAGAVWGSGLTAATGKPGLVAIPLTSLAVIVAGTILSVKGSSPWQRAVIDVNDAARRRNPEVSP